MEASTGCAEIPGAFSQLLLAELQEAHKIVDHKSAAFHKHTQKWNHRIHQ